MPASPTIQRLNFTVPTSPSGNKKSLLLALAVINKSMPWLS